MKRKIAMRCTQEQFESIKGRINLPIAEDVFRYAYDINSYLGNNYNGMDLVKFTLSPELYEEIHETFNADIFLEACGVEVEKVWKGSEMQYKEAGEWRNCNAIEYRLKPHPNYQKEIEALQQKAKEN